MSIGGKNVLIHKLILPCPDGMATDHVNNDPLDNRRENLRVVTISENRLNRSPDAKVRGRAEPKPFQRMNAKDFSTAQLLRAWHTLTPMQKGVVSQHRREGKTFKLISEESGYSLTSVANAWYRARAKIVKF